MAVVTLDDYMKNHSGYSTRKDLMQDTYQSEHKSIDADARAQSQASDISYRRLLKYLPEYNTAMGLNGNRLSETALLDANARYRSEQGKIAANASSQKAAAKNTYHQNLLNLYAEADKEHQTEQNNTYTAAKDVLSDYAGTDEEAKNYVAGLDLAEGKGDELLNHYQVSKKTKLQNEQNDIYQIAWNTLTNWSGSDKDAQAELIRLKPLVTEDQYKSLANGYATRKQAVEEEETAKAEEVKATIESWNGTVDGLYAYVDENINSVGNQAQEILNLSDEKGMQLNVHATKLNDIKLKGVNKEFTPGDNFRVKIGEETYNVELGDVVAQPLTGDYRNVTDKEVLVYKAAENSDIPDKTVFQYNGELYYMNGKNIHRVQARKLDGFFGGETDYDDLKNYLKP